MNSHNAEDNRIGPLTAVEIQMMNKAGWVIPFEARPPHHEAGKKKFPDDFGDDLAAVRLGQLTARVP